jgi:hypothetical protein
MPLAHCARRVALFFFVSASASAPALASHYRQPVVVTLDGHHYVSYGPGVTYTPPLKLVQAPELRMSNCHRANGEALAPGSFRLVYSASGGAIDATAMNMRFQPMRIELTTQFGDVLCEGEALGWEHGIERLFLDDFEIIGPPV